MQLREHAPIFIAAACDWDDLEKETRNLGVSGFLTKPFFCSTLCDGFNEYVLHGASRHCKSKKEKAFDFSGKRFLLAEDNELNREIVIELLSASGAQIDTVVDGLHCDQVFNRSPVGYYD